MCLLSSKCAVDGSMIVASLGLDTLAYLELYYIDLIYGLMDLFFPYDYYNLGEMSALRT